MTTLKTLLAKRLKEETRVTKVFLSDEMHTLEKLLHDKKISISSLQALSHAELKVLQSDLSKTREGLKIWKKILGMK